MQHAMTRGTSSHDYSTLQLHDSNTGFRVLFFCELECERGCAIGRAVVYDEDFEVFWEGCEVLEGRREY